MGSTIVEALYQYNVDLPDGKQETVSPGDKFKLIKKSNSDWWYVQFVEDGASFYLPATYLKELNERTAKPEPSVVPDKPERLTADCKLDENGQGHNGEKNHNNVLTVGDSSMRRRSSAPHGSSFKSVPSARFHHDLPIQEVDYPDGRNGGPTRPSQLSFRRDIPRVAHRSPQSPSKDPSGYPAVDPQQGEWRTLCDSQGRTYYHNQTTGQTQWEPPRGTKPVPMVRSPNSVRRSSEGSILPAGWREEMSSNGETVFIHDATNQKWCSSIDTQGEGRRYYYSSENPGDVRWQLPETLPEPVHRRNDRSNILNRGRPDSQRPMSMYTDRTAARRGAFQPNFPMESNLVMDSVHELESASPTASQPPPIMIAIHSPTSPTLPKHHVTTNVNRRYSDSVEDISPDAIPLEKEGILSKLQLTENGRKIKPKWVIHYTTLSGSKLSFYKDIKNVEKGNTRTSPTGPPDSTFELYGAELKWPKNERAKLGRKFAFELSLPNSEILVQGETEEDCLQWFQAINNGIRALGPNQRLFSQSNQADIFPDSPEGKSKPKSPTRDFSESDARAAASKSKIKDKLKSFISKRPNPEVLKEKGILKEENVFGKRLVELCKKEKSTVPRFILSCIEAIDNRGLEVDGVYRVSGNLSMMQRLRFQVDQEKPLNLNEPPWNDIHVIAGSLKLFFRELPEPLFTFEAYDRFIQCATMNDTKQRVKKIRELLNGLPREHKDTIIALFSHLRRVIDHGEKNRMKAQNVAIVFGPTLMWSKKESFNLATNLILQNRLMEHILNDFDIICKS